MTAKTGKRGGDRGGRRPRTRPANSKRRQVFLTDEEFDRLKEALKFWRSGKEPPGTPDSST